MRFPRAQSEPSSTRASSADRALCDELLPLVSRTFALSIEALPGSVRDAVQVAYLLCRIVDTAEDGVGLTLADRRSLFDAFDELLSDDRRDPARLECLFAELAREVVPAERRLCVGAGAVFRSFRALPEGQREAIRPRIATMSRGMREYVERAASEANAGLIDLADFERYCYFVAGTVGELLTALFLQLVPGLGEGTVRALEERAVSFGLGLQMVNIVKDVAADLARGACYLPRRLGAGAPALPDGLLQRDTALVVVRAVCERARAHLRRAREYTELWPVPQGLAVRLFCAVPLALALATLDEVESGDTLMRAPKLSRDAVSRILHEARAAVASDRALDALLAGARTRPETTP